MAILYTLSIFQKKEEAKPQQSAKQKICQCCDGEGVTYTGIAEAPTSQCRDCGGTGLDDSE